MLSAKPGSHQPTVCLGATSTSFSEQVTIPQYNGVAASLQTARYDTII
jgi:hypothetical protein